MCRVAGCGVSCYGASGCSSACGSRWSCKTACWGSYECTTSCDRTCSLLNCHYDCASYCGSDSGTAVNNCGGGCSGKRNRELNPLS